MHNGYVHINNFASTLAAPATSSATAIDLSDAAPIDEGSVAPPAVMGTGDMALQHRGAFVALTIIPAGGATSLDQMEIVHVVGAEGTMCAVVRAQEGTTAKEWPAGSIIEARLTAMGVASWMQPQFPRTIEFGMTSYDYPLSPITNHNTTVSFQGMVNISTAGRPCYGAYSVNVGSGYIEAPKTTNNASEDDVNSHCINIGSGTISDIFDGTGIGYAINVGSGSARGEMSINVGSGTSNANCVNIGPGSAAVLANAPAMGSVNIGSADIDHTQSVVIGYSSGTGGSFGTQATAIGANAGAGGQGVAIGADATTGSQLNSVALGAATQCTTSDQVNVGPRELEIGTSNNSKGIILYSPNGTRYALTVDDAGAIQVAASPLGGGG